MKIIHLLPNLITVSSICAGMTSIRFGYQGEFEIAVQLVLVACVLDGIDGRVARLLKCPTPLGAELDSLADFLNFGVAPVLIIYSWGFAEGQSVGWLAVLAYSVCCVLRLARFNVGNQSQDKAPSDRFVGVPSPAGAILVMLPMFVSFWFADVSLARPGWVAAYVFIIGLLMISRLPTYAFKNITIDRANAKYFLLGAGLLVGALFTYLWATLVIMTLIYAGSLVAAARSSFLGSDAAEK